jgi:hypothetical protein
MLDGDWSSDVCSSDLGRWSEDLGYLKDLSNDTVIELRADGTGEIVTPDERIDLLWEVPAPGRLLLFLFGNPLGPFEITMERKRLPLGEFTELNSSRGILPFDRGRFTKVE